MDSTVVLVDEAFRHTLAAGKLFDRLDFPIGSPTGETVDEAFEPRPAGTLRDRYRDALEGETRTFQITCWGRDLWVQAAPVRDATGEITAAMGLFLDASALRWHVDALEILRQRSADLLAASSRADLFETLVEVVTAQLPLSGATVYLFDEAAAVLRPEATAGDHVDPDPVSPGEHLVWEAFKRDAIVFGDEIAAERADTVGDRFVVPFGERAALAVRGSDAALDLAPVVEFVQVLCLIAGSVAERLHHERRVQAHDQELQRWARQLERARRQTALLEAVVQATVSAETLELLHAAVCECLARSDGIEFAWIGHLDRANETVELRASAGSERGTLDRTPVELEGNDEPTARAIIDREPVIINNVATGFDDEWRLAALEHGVQSIAAIPLLHGEMLHGVVTLHADDPNAFDELGAIAKDIGRIVGHASTAIQCQNALLSHVSMELDIEITAPACFFVRFVQETGTSVSFGSISSTDDGWCLVFVTAEAPELLLEHAERAVSVRSAQPLEDDAGDLIEVQFDDSFIGSFLSRHGISLQRASATPEEVQITVSIPPSMSPRQALDAIQAEYPDSRLLAKREQRHSEGSPATTSDSIFNRLTDRQREAVERAHAAGYFETPKQATGTEIAESMDISASAFHNHLRTAESEVFKWLFDTSQE
jgi:predicted DNA binding protein/uncharacterized protein YigA (DUF484 family)